MENIMSKEYKGNAVVGGVGTGKVKIIDCSCPEFKIREIEDSDRELGRFVRALKTFCGNCRKEIDYIEENIGHNEAAILNSHITMTHDLALQTELISKISNGMCAEQATCEICDSYIKRFLGDNNDIIRQLYLDVLDVEISILHLLLGIDEPEVSHFDEDTVIVAYELTPSIVAKLDQEHTKGIVLDKGTFNSHGAKIAAKMNIPSVASVKNVDRLVKDGDIVTVDGENGILIVKNED